MVLYIIFILNLNFLSKIQIEVISKQKIIKKEGKDLVEFKLIENEVIPVYEKEGERLINARELHDKLKIGKDFTTWIKDRIRKYQFIENQDYILTFPKIGERQNVKIHEYFLTIDMSKEICMIENNTIGRKIRKYFIESEKRYREIMQNPQNIFDFMRIALNQIEENESRITTNEKDLKNFKKETNENIKNLEISNLENAEQIKDIKSKIDVIISKDYCLASDIAEQLQIYSKNQIPHSNLIGAIARVLGYKISYKHYYEDENIAIVTDISKGKDYWQVYYKPKATEEITKWFNENKKEIEYKIIYEKNTKNGVKGEVREHGYKIEDICYKVL